MNLGTIGIWTSYRPFGIERAGEAAKLVEQLGYGAWWLGGSPHVADVRPILEATSALTAATGILNVWANDPAETAAQDAALRARVPRPVRARHRHRPPRGDERLPAPADGDAGVPRRARRRAGPAAGRGALPGRAAARRCSTSPRERSAGAHTYFVPVEHTRPPASGSARASSLAPEVACVVETDPARAKAVARDYAELYLGLSNYTQNLLNLGFTEDDFADGGSDRLIDAVIPHGSAGEIAEAVRAHLDAGADHVCVQPLGEAGDPARVSGRRSRQALID